MLPKDPAILLSMLNMLLRDRYSSLDELCDDREEDRDTLTALMENAGWRYESSLNRFIKK